MVFDVSKQLNPFEIKAVIASLITKSIDDNDYLNMVQLLDAQSDKKTIVKILYKEFYNLKTDDGTSVCFLLERYAEKEELTKRLWELLKNNMVANNVKIVAVNFLRGLQTDWTIDTGDEILDNEILDADTRKLLDNAIINPEIQIDFLDFLTSISPNDKITLINSLGDDYTNDALANILIPVFLSQPDSETGKTALNLLGESKSQLAFHALNSALEFVNEDIKPLVKKNISILKLAGIREDNSHEFYRQILSESKPYRVCATYPDGHGNQALIFTRITPQNKVRFMAVVVDDYHGIRDCFGFYEISQFECDKIIERFYKNEKEINLTPQALKTILLNAEKISKQNANNWLLPYEYICWKNILNDIEGDNRTYKEILTDNLSGQATVHINNIFDMDFSDKWFLNAGYSDEFEALTTCDNITDETISAEINKIFYQEEKEIWTNRLLSVAFLKLQNNEKDDAEQLYSLYCNDELKQEFFKTILKKSIYEYYVNLKFNTALNNGRYTLAELDEIINRIEEQWVCTK